MDRAAREWAACAAASRPELVRAGYFGSYARGDRGVGSGLDLLLVVRGAREPFERRAADGDAGSLPVPTDARVYTVDEWSAMGESSPFGRRANLEVVWVYQRCDLNNGRNSRA